DQAFPSVESGPPLQRPPVVGHLLADAERFGELPPQVRFEVRPALGEGQPAEILVAVAQQVERDNSNRLRLVDVLDVASSGQVNAPLQPLEAGWLALLVERD